MRKHSVVFKLFVVTSVLIVIVFALVLLAEVLFFERYYRTSKIHALERSMNQFAEQFTQAQSNEHQVSRLLGAFMNHNDASASILNDRFERTNINPYFLELQTDNKTITIRIPMEGITIDEIPRGIHIGDSLVVDGVFMDEKDTIMHPVVLKPISVDLEEGLVRVKGKVTDLMLPERRSYNPLYQDALIGDVLLEWNLLEEQYQPRLQNGSPIQMEWRDQWSGVQYAILIQPLSEGKYGNRYVFAMTSLQPVGEAVDVLKKYFVYVAPIILVLVIILSLIYSKIVSELVHANVKLQEDMEEKQRSDQLRKELIANISHELKTPLGIVKGFAEGLQDGVAGDKRDRYLALIVNETDRMNALIMDMLELSKLEAKAIRLQPRGFSLTNLIQRVVDSFYQQLESKNLQCWLNQDDEDELFVEGDPKRIEQVVLNLLSNAIRHATEHSIITITVRRTAAGTVITVIENTGSPIAEEYLSRIWDQFYRAEHSRDRKSGGTGLGLAIVKHILELHQSEFGVTNTNQGVAFSFTLYESREKPNEK